MAINLAGRIEKLEAEAGAKAKPYPKVIRLIAREQDEAEVLREAAALGYDTGPESTDILIVRLIGGGRLGQAVT